MKIINQKFLVLAILLFFTGFFFVSAQNGFLKGQVTDSLQNPLPNANILALPINTDDSMAFAIADGNGEFSLEVKLNVPYELTISYLGYAKKVKTVKISENAIENFILKESAGQLEEILIKSKIPVIIKKDTIIYNVESFIDGTERKLRDVLKNLPGVEVDRDGNVSVNGKKITKVLIENKTFFTGDSKLAVNNIPADAVDQVEVLDNYSEIAMLKGLQDSDAMALNINLKEDKKNFVFGDIEAGGGVKERYLVNPKLFYYSPLTSFSFIGDVNNIAEKSFTLSDYINFEGGYSSLLNDSSSFSEILNSDVAQFISNRDFTNSVSKFGALNIQQALPNNFDLTGYVIASTNKIKTASTTINNFLQQENSFIEERILNNAIRNNFILGKATLSYKPSFEEEFTYNSFAKLTNIESNEIINTSAPQNENSINANYFNKAIRLQQKLNYSRRFSEKHTATLEAIYIYENGKPVNRWVTNQPILEGLIPLEEDNIYRLLQDKRINSHNFNAVIKDYWVLSKFHHLYPSFGVKTLFSEFLSNDRQELTNGILNSFEESNFNNDFKYALVNTYLGIEYKFQIGKATFKPAVYMNFFTWQTKQFENSLVAYKAVLLPELDSDIVFNSTEKLSFKYRFNTRFPNINQLADRFILSNFNSIFRGNNTLQNELYHTATLNYYKFKIYDRFRMNFSASFNKKEKSFKNTTVLNGIEQFNTIIPFDSPEHTLNFNMDISQDWKNIRYNLKGNFIYSDFFQVLNTIENLNISKITSGTVGIKTLFDKFPSLELGYKKDFYSYRATNGKTNFTNDNLFGSLDYTFLKDFIFKSDYSYNQNINRTTNGENTFDILNSSLFYQQEDSPWGFEVSGNNLLDAKFKQQNSFSNFLISNTRTFIFPRTILFKIQYKL
ncbi:carboxypeptidase-like regulatory domain-containing protein [Rasiella sp. SM2506]|uniref:carboxypeptidase-like regulatory domain-containing protein n=1 Tax=Rasiella sp. SM2506 TaxID=3423914 RepID=UPI003D7A61FF